MAEEDPNSGVEIVHEEDWVRVEDRESGLTADAATKSEALRRLAEALELRELGGESLEGDTLRDLDLDLEDVSELGFDVEDVDLPEFDDEE